MFTEVYNPEQQLIAEIERLELEARSTRKRLAHAHTDSDKRVLIRLLADLERDIEVLRERLE